jgi:Ca2+/Na+ antiporter
MSNIHVISLIVYALGIIISLVTLIRLKDSKEYHVDKRRLILYVAMTMMWIMSATMWCINDAIG